MANDYNLGRAVGEVVITADTDGATRAMGDYERATQGATDAAQQQSRIERELTERRRAATEAANRRRDAEAEYKRVMADSTATVEDQVRVEEERNRARGEHLQAARRAADAERALRAELVGNIDAVNRFTRSLDQSAGGLDNNTNKLREMRMEADQLSRSLNVVGSALSGAIGAAAKGTAIGGAAAGAGGLLGLLGAGGAQGLVSGLSGITAAVIQYTGAIGLIPAVGASAATVLGTLTIATQGFAEAMKSWDDPEKFVEQINKLGPATRQAALEVYQYRDAIKGAQNVIADGLFQPLIQEIEPLIQTLLPVMMNLLRNVAQAIGQTGAEFAQWLRSSETVAAITQFVNNLVEAINIARQAMAPFLDAFRTLAVVGSQFLPQLAQIIVNIANSFNTMVQNAANDGRLQAWIQSAITAFQLTLDIIQNVGSAILNIFSLSGSDSGNFLKNLEEITRQWKVWTESMEGQSSILEFFSILREATNNLMPILGELGKSVGIIIRTLVGLGNSSASGLQSFFSSITEALRILEPSLVAAGPAIGQAFKAIGDAIVQIVQGVGPQLPNIFQTFADVLSDILPIVVAVVTALGNLLGSLTPGQVELILSLAVAFQALGGALSIAMTLLPALAGAAAALGIGMGPLIGIIAAVVATFATFFAVGFMVVKHWDDIKAATQGLWDRLKEFGSWLGEFFSGLASDAFNWGKNLINGLIDGIWSMTEPVRNAVGNVAEIIDDFLHPGSPTKRGPLSDISTEEMGERLGGGLASGLESSSTAVTSASGRVAGGVASSFTTAGVSGREGNSPKSGFEQWVEGLTGELSMWSRFLQNGMNLAKSVADIFVQGTKIVASLWNQGDNPLTRPGGIAGRPLKDGERIGQKSLFGVPMPEREEDKGTAPLPELTPQHYQKDSTTQGGQLPEQKGVNGVPSANPPASTQGSAPPKTQGAQPPKTQGSAPAGTGGSLPNGWRSSQQEVANAIYAEGKKRGWSDEKIQQAMGTSWQESALGAASPYQGGDPNIPGDVPMGIPNGGLQIGPEGLGPMGEWGDYAVGYFQQKPRYYPNATDPMGNITAFFDNVDKAGGDIIGVQKGIYGMGEVNANIDAIKPFFDAAKNAPAQTQGSAPPNTIPVPGAPSGRRTLDASDFGGIDLQDQPNGVALPGGPVVTGTGGRGIPSPRIVPIPPGGNADGLRAMLGPRGSYGVPNPGPNERTEDLPQWVQDLGAAFGLGGSTYGGHQTNGADGHIGSGDVEPNPQGLNRGIDWWPLRNGKQYTDMSGQSYTPDERARLDAFANFLANNGLSEQVIWRNPETKESVGFPFNTDYSSDYGGHEGHVHSRHSASIILGNAGVPLPAGFGGNVQGSQRPQSRGQDSPRVQGIPIPGGPIVTPSGGAAPERLPQAPQFADGYSPADLRRYANDPNAVRPTQIGQIGATAGYNGINTNFEGTTSQMNAASAQAPLDQFGSAIASAGNIAADAFAVFNNVIKNIDATAKIALTLNRGFENTEDINKTVDQVQTFIETASSIAKLVSSGTGLAAGAVGAGAGSDPSGGAAGAAAALGAVSSIASLVSAGLTAVNAGIDLGQEAYRIVSKYGAMFAGIMLGGPDTGALGGNVRMMLNTRTGELISYSAENPDNKESKNLPKWISRAYGGTREQPIYQQTQLNLYTGPGSNPNQLISDTMWLVTAGAPQAASVAGYN